jgi:integrase
MDQNDPKRPWSERPPHLVRDTNGRDGTVYVYFRYPGRAKVQLSEPWGTQALADKAKALTAAAIAAKPPKPATGTLVGAVKDYRGDRNLSIEPSADFIVLAASTQKEYERICDEFENTFAGVLLEDVNAGYVMDLRDKWAPKGYRAANVRLQVLKNICKEPRIRGTIPGNPFELIDKVERPQSLGVANPRWLDEEVEAAIEYAIAETQPGMARAIALGRWGGFRRQSICKLPKGARIWRANDDGVRERRLLWVTEKRLVLCDRREDPRLTALLERTEKMKARFAGNVEPLTLAFNAYGEAWTEGPLDRALGRLLKPLAKAGKVRAGLTLHGLRHARGVEIALAGGSDAHIMSQLDHATARQAAEYRKQAERLHLADAGQDLVDGRVIKLADRRRAKETG